VTRAPFERQDFVPLAVIAALPLVAALPLLLGLLQADPLLYMAELAQLERGPLRGVPYADPNNGYTTLALGYRAALDWLQGSVPWWNPYSGVGLPLAAEYQPAAFFPFVFLLLLPKGTVLLQVALQVIAGWGTYGLLRHLGASRLAASTAGLLFAFNGTLAWFAHGPATAVPFLPWMAWGIERIFATAQAGAMAGWRMLALAMAMSLAAGFPETAYINGLLALAWAVLRGMQLDRDRRARYAMSVAIGGSVGIVLAAPQIASFLLYLRDADVGGHTGDFADAALPAMGLLPALVAPYVYGPIMGYLPAPLFQHFWGTAGGYATILLVMAGLLGAIARRDALSVLLVAWTVVVLGKTWAIEPFLTLANLVPGVSFAAFARYAHPSWEFALAVLAGFAIDAVLRGTLRRLALAIAMALALCLALGATTFLVVLWPEITRANGLRNAAIGSMAWAAATLSIACAFAWRLTPRRAAQALAALLVLDAAVMYVVPTLSNPRRATLEVAALDFLRANLGLQRFYSLEPFQPNFGAYFGLASINHNYLPVARRWIGWIRTHLDANLPDVAVFNGNSPGAAQRLVDNLEPYRALGVKYVIVPPHSQPFAGWPPRVGELERVYRGTKMAIYELPRSRPYVEVVAGRCETRTVERTHMLADCAEPSTLLRRELNFPGWRVTVNGAKAPMLAHDDLFQAVELPKGKSEVRFAYAPPRIGWAWAAAAAVDQRAARHGAPRPGAVRHTRARQEQQGERDEIRHHARKDEEEPGHHGAHAIGERDDGKAAMGEAGGQPRQHREASLLDERHAGAGCQDNPGEHPPAQRVGKPHQHQDFEQGETQ
jgi:hypothetical protein